MLRSSLSVSTKLSRAEGRERWLHGDAALKQLPHEGFAASAETPQTEHRLIQKACSRFSGRSSVCLFRCRGYRCCQPKEKSCSSSKHTQPQCWHLSLAVNLQIAICHPSPNVLAVGTLSSSFIITTADLDMVCTRLLQLKSTRLSSFLPSATHQHTDPDFQCSEP